MTERQRLITLRELLHQREATAPGENELIRAALLRIDYRLSELNAIASQRALESLAEAIEAQS